MRAFRAPRFVNLLDAVGFVPDNARMAEWLKILISALAGMSAGIAAEPLRHWVVNRLTVNAAREAIYGELGMIDYYLKDCDDSQQCGWAMANIQTNAFDYYYNSRREVLYLLPECNALVAMYARTKHSYDLYCRQITKELTAARDIQFMFKTYRERNLIDIPALDAGREKHIAYLNKFGIKTD